MNNTVIERTEARIEKNTEWRLSNQKNGNFLDVVFCKELENTMKKNVIFHLIVLSQNSLITFIH